MEKASIARFVSVIVAELAYFGVNVPESTEQLIVGVAVGLVALYAAFKNNYLTKRGKEQASELDKKGLK